LTANDQRDFDGNMKTRLILIVCLVVLPIAIVCNFPPTIKGAGADEKAIREADEAWSTAAAAKDVDKTVAFYSEDAVVMPPNAERAASKEAIRKIWKDMLTDAKVSWKATKVEVAKSGDIGFAIGTYEVTMNDVVTGKPINDHGKYVEVWEKQVDGSWKCGADIFNSDIPLTKAEPEKK
jgi:ketosteroid isomerase-like protein